MDAIRRRPKGEKGPRDGGVVWHTQGSGKSLTMVMIAKALALEPDVPDYKIILVTDRVDLDDQIYKTFRHCGTEPVQARTGRHLAELVNGPKSRIVTTVIDKFETAVGKAGAKNPSPNIFVLVDEGHRGQYGALHTKMRKGLPNACFIAFTGTPVVKREKNTIRQFGGLIDTYRITDAVKDKAVVPLLYEGRDVEQRVDRDEIDRWFERETRKLTPRQRADLKKKFATSKVLSRAEKRVKEIAYDVSLHYANWQGTPFKAQLVAPSKATAILFKKFLDDIAMVTSEVLISAPDDREGNEDIYEDNADSVVAFWKKMMEKYGSERAYNTNVINAFKNADQPEIIIVVNKLLTVEPDLTVRANAPRSATADEVAARLKERAAWIARQRAYFEQFRPERAAQRYVSGASLWYLGRQYRLRMVEGLGAAKLVGQYLQVPAAEKDACERKVKEWYRERSRAQFTARLELCYAAAKAVLKVEKPPLVVRQMVRRWGSCTATGRVILNTDLVRAPLHCIDYVIVHELCHVVHGHNKAFYRLLSACMPDWERRKARLESFVV